MQNLMTHHEDKKHSSSNGGSTKGGVSGIFGFFISSSKQSDNSSDDEAPGFADDADYIHNGQRGIVVLSCHCLRTDKKKIFHIHLYSGQIYQYAEGRRKIYNCSDVTNVIVRSDKTVLVDMKKTRGHVQKRYFFETEDDALKYQQYIEFRNDTGTVIRSSFDQIDRKGQKLITVAALKMALRVSDLEVTEQDVKYMLLLNDGNGEYFDFQDYFCLFFDSQVSNMRECLLEWLYQARALRESQQNIAGDSKSTKSFADTQTNLLANLIPGEIVANVVDRVRWSINMGKAPGSIPSPGTMIITNFRIIFVSARKTSTDENYHCRYDIPPFFATTSVPLSAISRAYVAPPRSTIFLCAKDFRIIRITLPGSNASNHFHAHHNGVPQAAVAGKAEHLVQTLQRMAFYAVSNTNGKMVERPFAYTYSAVFTNDGWRLSDIMQDYRRQGLLDCREWRLFDNSSGMLSDSYPPFVIVPTEFSDAELYTASAYRSKQRLPVVTYRHTREGVATGAVLTRSAQPMVGLTMKLCSADEKLLNMYRLRGKTVDHSELEQGPTKFYILDARRQIAATLNMAAGKGTEDVSVYRHTELIFCNIENIHVMRTSAQILAELLLPGGNQDLQSKETFGGSGTGHFTRLEESGWLKHTRMLLMAGVLAAEKLHLEGASILVHCSDGWDRTSQICSLAELILDPYYRTIEGFAVLVEKEWCAFGYKFQDRSGHGVDHTNNPDDRSPVFLQFLDTVFQLLTQFPTAFEFTESMLVFLADHAHSGLFGSFLGNTHKQRLEELRVREQTHSVWSYILEFRERFSNRSYAAYGRPIWPSCSMSRIVVWERYFNRWDPEAHPNFLSGIEWHDDWGAGLETKIRIDTGGDGGIDMDSAYSLPPSPRRSDSSQIADSGAAAGETGTSTTIGNAIIDSDSPTSVAGIIIVPESSERASREQHAGMNEL